MRAVVVGAGPTGLLAGAGLARRGHRVTVVDRDGGPEAGGRWQRRGVMQFGHAHGFRAQAAEVLRRQWPDAYETWLRLGAEPVEIDLPDLGRLPGGMLSRRLTFERALRRSAASVAGLDVRQGHVDRLHEPAGRVTGLVVDGSVVEADVVVDASGRSGRLGRTEAHVGGDCGIAYVNRTYRLLPGAERGPMSSPIAWFGSYDGYAVIVFPHEGGHFSVVVVRPTADPVLRELRHDDAFDAACRAIPALAEWTDPNRSVATSGATAGGALRNTYHPQRLVPGLVAIGDAVTTTAPTAGRGVAMSYLQVEELLRLVDAGVGPDGLAEPFELWSRREMLPWVLDHVAVDDSAARRWQGHDIDLTRPLPSDLVAAAAVVDPRLNQYVGPYLAMTALPATLADAEPWAHTVYETGWRPAYSEGPSRDALVEVIHKARAEAA